MRVDGATFEHPVYVPPKRAWNVSEPETNPIPASALRNLGWPDHAISQGNKDSDPTFRRCVSKYPAPACPCGAYTDLEWE